MKALDSAIINSKDHPLISRIRVWLELGGKRNRNTGSVEVGEATTLGIRALLPGSIGVRVVDCSAMDGIGETSQKLLDERGCPVDVQVITVFNLVLVFPVIVIAPKTLNFILLCHLPWLHFLNHCTLKCQ